LSKHTGLLLRAAFLGREFFLYKLHMVHENKEVIPQKTANISKMPLARI